MGCSDSTLTDDTHQIVSTNNSQIATVNNSNRRFQEKNSVSSRKARNDFTAAQRAWQMEALKSHNSFRARHGVSALVLDDEISHKAQDYAEYLAKKNRFEHSKDRDGLGENLYWKGGSASLMNDSLGTDATESWYSEIKNYDYNNPGFSMTTGHFTQVVWKNTSKLGIGVAFSNEGRKVVVVARYGPPGNYTGQFPENVPALR